MLTVGTREERGRQKDTRVPPPAQGIRRKAPHSPPPTIPPHATWPGHLTGKKEHEHVNGYEPFAGRAAVKEARAETVGLAAVLLRVNFAEDLKGRPDKDVINLQKECRRRTGQWDTASWGAKGCGGLTENRRGVLAVAAESSTACVAKPYAKIATSAKQTKTRQSLAMRASMTSFGPRVRETAQNLGGRGGGIEREARAQELRTAPLDSALLPENANVQQGKGAAKENACPRPLRQPIEAAGVRRGAVQHKCDEKESNLGWRNENAAR